MDFIDAIVDDVEIYEGLPDYARNPYDEIQDVALPNTLARTANSFIHTWRETLDWYRSHQTSDQIGFNPDGMCLRICREARGIPARYATAKLAQDATPKKHRVVKVRDLRQGMVLYFDDPTDSNRSGHIATQIGRVKDFDPDDLNDVLVETNSVVSGQIVVVRATYFTKHWGDPFRFGATWLNGFVLDVPKPPSSRVAKFHDGGPVYDLNILHTAAKAGRPAAEQALRAIETLVKALPDSPKLVRVRLFKDQWRDTRTIDLSLLDQAVAEGRTGVVKRIRDQIVLRINTLPPE